MERWCGKIAVVTGASTGIGAAIAKKFVEHGLIVVGLARRSELIEKHAKELSKEPGKLHAFKADMTREKDIIDAINWTVKTLGPIYILINNAGIVSTGGLLNTPTDEWKNILNINVLGICIATREVCKVMIKNNIDGHVVHINGIAGHKCIYQFGIYGPSKYAVTNLTEVLRQELNASKSKIKISSISPGATATEISGINIENLPLEMQNIPKLNAEDIADAVVYVIGTPPHVQVHELIIKPVNEQM